MTDDPRLRDILNQAWELPPEQRTKYLDNACGGDTELRAEVESLLRSLEQADEFLDRPTMTSSGVVTPANGNNRYPIGSHIGPYRLVEKIGEGGMGMVFLAEQNKPVQRRVALKIIKPGMDSAAVIARFEAERQVLALMDHSNIARVYDAGTTDNGHPYFVMELVQGADVTRYCDENRLNPRQRLELFISICQAVQHAHQKGIIHRDLKPSNVLVTMQDGRPVVKVIDFGIAKAIDRPMVEKTAFTQLGAFVGTPEYMSPEQAGANPLETDTRSDVYTLGVILYELLTGTTPLDRKQLRQAGYEQMMRTIREVDPPRPSTRLSTAGEGTASASAQRSMDPKKLANLLAGDIDCIVMKCLEKDRSRRYDTVGGLSEDIDRYLRNEPINARPASRVYLIGKFIRRHSVFAGASALVVIALLLGVAIAGIGLIRARRAQAATDKALVSEQQQRKRAESRFNDARQMASAMFKFDDDLIDVPGSTSTRRKIVALALKYLDRLNQDTLANASLLRELAVSYDRLGDVLGNPNNPNLGDVHGALDSQQQALAIRQKLLATDPDNEGLNRDVFVAYSKIAELQGIAGNTSAAMESYQKSLKIGLSLLASAPDDPRANRDVAMTYCQIGDVRMQNNEFAKAMEDYQKALATGAKLQQVAPTDPQTLRDLALIYENLGDAELGLGKVDDAVTDDTNALTACRKLATNPTNGQAQRDLSVAYSKLGDAQLTAKKLNEALDSHGQALDICIKMQAADASNAQAQRDLGIAYVRVGHTQAALKNNTAALANFKKAIDIDRERARRSPTNAQAQADLSIDYQEAGIVQDLTGSVLDALASYRQCVEIDSKLAQSNPDDPEAQLNAATTHGKLAYELLTFGAQNSVPLSARLKALQDARSNFQSAIDIYSNAKAKAMQVNPQDLTDVTTGLKKCNDKIAELDKMSATQPT